MSSREYYREYYQQNREEILAKQKANPSRTSEENREYMKAYYQANKDKWDHRREENREAINQRKRERYANDPEYQAKTRDRSVAATSRLRRERPYRRRSLEWGLSEETIELMFNKGCEICGAKPHVCPDLKLRIDHDHRSGHIRGVLCDSCNLALGKISDDPLIAMAMFEYLMRHSNG